MKVKSTHCKGNSKDLVDSMRPVQLVGLKRKHQLEKALAMSLAQKRRETICCSIMYLPNSWSGISTIFLTDCCSLSFYSRIRDCEGSSSLQPYRLHTHFFFIKGYTHTHTLCPQLYRCVISNWDIKVISARAFIMSLLLTMFFSSSKAGRQMAGRSPLQNSDHLKPNKPYLTVTDKCFL